MANNIKNYDDDCGNEKDGDGNFDFMQTQNQWSWGVHHCPTEDFLVSGPCGKNYFIRLKTVAYFNQYEASSILLWTCGMVKSWMI